MKLEPQKNKKQVSLQRLGLFQPATMLIECTDLSRLVHEEGLGVIVVHVQDVLDGDLSAVFLHQLGLLMINNRQKN